MKRLLIICVFMIPTIVGAQGTFRYYDSLTFQQFQEQRYSEVISTGKKALNEGFDYYYLRMRMGISAYELGRYDLAFLHFEAAGKQNIDNTLAEYLYYSLLLSGRVNEARIFYCNHRDNLPRISESCKKVVSSIYLEGGNKFSSNEVREIGDIFFFHAGITHLISPRFQVYQGYSRIRQEFREFEWVAHGMNGHGPGGPSDSVEVANDASLNQNEYYLNPRIQLGRFMISPAFHYQGIQNDGENYAVSLQVSQRVRLLQWRLAFASSKINSLTQQLYTAGITLYPTGSASAYIDAAINGHLQDQQLNWVYQAKAGIMIVPANWLEFSYGWGDMFNYSDINAFYIYNLPDTIKSRWGVTFNSQLWQKHMLSAGYLFEKKHQTENGATYEHKGFFIGLILRL